MQVELGYGQLCESSLCLRVRGLRLTYVKVDKSGVKCTAGGGTTVLESHGWVYGPGGQGVFSDPSLGPVLYYHYGKLLCYNTINGKDIDNSQWIPASATPTARSSLESTRSASRVDGRLYDRPSCSTGKAGSTFLRLRRLYTSLLYTYLQILGLAPHLSVSFVDIQSVVASPKV